MGVESTAAAAAQHDARAIAPDPLATITAAATAQHNAQALRTPKHGVQI